MAFGSEAIIETSTRKNTIFRAFIMVASLAISSCNGVTDILTPEYRYNESGTPLCDASVIGIAGGSAPGKV
jgi:hypothetical protein